MRQNVRENLELLKNRAAVIRSNPNLRHTPDDCDRNIVSEDAKMMQYHQEQVINIVK